MLAMSDIHCIKNLRNEKGMSINKIATTLGIDWRSAKKYADGDLPDTTIIKKKNGMMYKEKWGTIISDWLLEDGREKKKQRRTNKQLFQELQSHGFDGSYRTVCNFIAEWRATHSEELPDKGTERLSHPEGEAQLDFGVMEAVEEGQLRDIHLLILSFPASNTAFYEPLPSENQECLLEGMKKLFRKAGGVPRAIRIDNMTTAVKATRSKTEEAALTDEFLRFQLHYGFHTQVCNVAKGNEKGHVEGKVGYVRYTLFSVPPVIGSLEDLSKMLDEFSASDQQRLHYEKEVDIKTLWKQEGATLLTFPENDFTVRKEKMVKPNPYNEIKIDNVLVHVPKAKNHVQLFLVLTWNEYKVVTRDSEVISSGLRPYMNKRRALPWKEVLHGWMEKPRVVEYSRYRRYLPGRLNDYLTISSLPVRRERISFILSLISTHSMQEINDRFYELASEYQHSENEKDHPYDVNWGQYDQLARQGDL